MFRKISLAAVAALALTAAAVAPASAGGGGHGGMGMVATATACIMAMAIMDMVTGAITTLGSSFYVGGSCYKTIFTEYGPRTVYVCDRYY